MSEDISEYRKLSERARARADKVADAAYKVLQETLPLTGNASDDLHRLYAYDALKKFHSRIICVFETNRKVIKD